MFPPPGCCKPAALTIVLSEIQTRRSSECVSIDSILTVDTKRLSLKRNAFEQEDKGQTALGFNNTVGNTALLFNITAGHISVLVFNKRFQCSLRYSINKCTSCGWLNA